MRILLLSMQSLLSKEYYSYTLLLNCEGIMRDK
jgi:hypothetical protein